MTDPGEVLAGAEKDALDKRGFVVLPNVVRDDRLMRLRAAFERSQNTALNGVCSHPVVLAAVRHVLKRPFAVLDQSDHDPPAGTVTALWFLDDYIGEIGAGELLISARAGSVLVMNGHFRPSGNGYRAMLCHFVAA